MPDYFEPVQNKEIIKEIIVTMNKQKHKDPNKRFLFVQVKRINLDKWYEGIRIKRDPGSHYVYRWIDEKAESFRNNWNNSRCRFCEHWHACGHEIRAHCSRFNHDKECMDV